MLILLFILSAINLVFTSNTCSNSSDDDKAVSLKVCISKPKDKICEIKKRRYDVRDMGWEKYFRGWADVQGQGAANDYCRLVGYEHLIQLSCALAGTQGRNDRGFNSSEKFLVGVQDTWYMKDEDGDGKDDYCRCLEYQGKFQVMCTKTGEKGFYGSPEQGGMELTFSTGIDNCGTRTVHKEFGRGGLPFVPH